MSVASTVPAITDALEDRYTDWLREAGENDGTDQGVTVHQGEPSDPPAEYVQIDDVDGTQEWQTLTSEHRTETYTVTSWVIVSGDLDHATQREMKARAFELFGVLAAGLRANTTLGFTGEQYLEVQVGTFRGQPTPREIGYGYLLRFEVMVEATF